MSVSRRDLLRAGAAAATVPLASTADAARPRRRPGRPLVNAYYFRAHMYTIVPRQVREDMKWMAAAGTDVVSLAVLEQDLYAAKENIELVCEEAARVGLSVFAVPSRWGGLVAGAPKVASTFTASNPQTWMLDRQGKPIGGIAGPMSSVHAPETLQFFQETLAEMLAKFPFKGIIWDEPKTLNKEDFSPAAQRRKPADAPKSFYTDAVADFFGAVSAHAKTIRPDVTVAMFLHASSGADLVERCARIEGIDHFGCDGRPWSGEDGGTLEASNKVLLPNARTFIEAARKNGKKSLVLVENHNFKAADIPLMDRRMPEVLALGAEHLIYYYYPRNVEDPERTMAVLRKHLRRV